MTVIAIPKVLREKLGDEGSEALIEILNKSEDKSKEHILEVAEGKFEKRLTEEISSVKVELARARADILKWIFIFWVGQISVLTSIMFAFFRK